MKKILAVAVVVKLIALVAFFAFFAAPAHADSFSISFNDGNRHYRDWDRGHRGHGWKHGHDRHYWNRHPHWPQFSAYQVSRPIVYSSYYYQQPLYVQPSQLVLGQQIATNDGQFCREYQSRV